MNNFSEYSSSLNINGTKLIAVLDDEIIIQEFYDSGIRYRGSEMALNNEILAVLRKDIDKLKVTIDLWRAFESRLLTNVFIILSFALSLLLMLGICGWFFRCITFNLLPLLVLILVFDLVIILMWTSSRMKYIGVKRLIKTVIGS